MSAPQRLAGSKTVWFDRLPRELDRAVEEFDIASSEAWLKVEQLSQQTEFIEIEVYGEAAIAEDGKTFAPATVYADLVYEPGTEEVRFSESFPARVYFDSDGKTVSIVDIDIDTSNIFE